MLWYLDAWDARGGRAFASQRAAINSRACTMDQLRLGKTASIYVGPPGFQPEPIANAAIGYSAGRAGAFEQRVPREGRELGFPAAQAVAEFVRRGFIAGGGTRGGGDGGAPGPPSGPESPPRMPDLERGDTLVGKEKASVVAALAGEFKKIAERLEKADIDTSDESSSKLAREIRERQFRLPSDFVMGGGLQLLSAMLYAYPNPPADIMHKRLWGRAALSLHRALGELDMWADLARYNTGQHTVLLDFLAQSVDVVLRRAGWTQAWPPNGPRSAAPAIASFILSADPEQSNGADFEYWFHYNWRGFPLTDSFNRRYSGAEGQQDRFEPIFFWPLPPYAIRTFPEIKSLGQLLSRYVSSPIEFAGTGPAVLQLVAFAAAFLGSRIEDRMSDGWQSRAAAAWLGRSIPRWIFSLRVEEIIRDVGKAQNSVTAHA
jgi:hypothetical protein